MPMAIWLLVEIRLLSVGVIMIAVVVVRPKVRGGALAVVVGPTCILEYLAALCPGMIATDVAVGGVWTNKRGW